jgi:hypothetical protein
LLLINGTQSANQETKRGKGGNFHRSSEKVKVTVPSLSIINEGIR